MNWRYLSEDVIIIETDESQRLAMALVDAQMDEIVDIIPGDQEVAVQFSGDSSKNLIERIAEVSPSLDFFRKLFVIPICYELGLDWEEVCIQTQLQKEHIIELHLSTSYEVNYGFTPGFLYLKGLDERLHCNRKQDPRIKIPAGSVGIGGDKTGIYSLESPGGWQIIGQTPKNLFDISMENPFVIPNGSQIQFERISLDQYNDH